MSPIEMARVVAVVVFLAVAGYSAARFVWSVTRRGSRTGILAADVPDLSHALMGVAMALMVSPAGPAVPEPLGIAAFTLLAAWFATRLRHDGLLSRAAVPALATAKHRLADLGDRDGRARGHGGYHLHHLAGCAAMVVMYLTGHGALAAGALATGATATAAGVDAASTGTGTRAGLDAHGALGAHDALPPLAALCWVLGLYFLVAATSLGFRVGESTVQLAHHTAHQAGDEAGATPNASAARLLTSPAGACATEVALSAGMAVLFFSAL
ncbi:DUF5134 domain-containing protein [Jiangella alkaliphila]|uniref:PEP-CTERM protein-sorting domain-containing protein n=1 Tax=Jiangella alkaliphila TaxID=419479 RepID=A0A1H2JTU5_9ACTN|nr:DUF5134 domain-containing protein [Jiangella alkaliphila]SDU59889.1 PEP-CTERM protein-sorting domain-containing protein [Jiangella alkaliphila]